jgi:hypothetical protein
MQMGEGSLTPLSPTLTPGWTGLPATPRRAGTTASTFEAAARHANGPGHRWPGPFTHWR